MALVSGTKLGPYEIQSPLGAGGMGEVYRATDTKLGRDVALKVLPAEMAQDPERLARFGREAKALAQLDHPNIVTIYSVEECDGVHFLTMQLVEGQPLDRLIPASGLPVEQIVEIAGALGDALAAAHEKGIVHRDLKPANVMVSNEGRVKVLDFGLAKDVGASDPADATLTSDHRTQAGMVMGTPAYMSPEQTSGRPLDHRTDIFSLGVLLHEMATGRRPFDGTSSAELISAILRDNPPAVTEARPDLPSDLARIVRRCLEKDPRHRVQTARDVSNEFRDLARQTSQRVTRATTSAAQAAPAADSGAARAAEGFWVAVLPFKCSGSNSDLTALAEGLTEDIVTGLSRFSYLRVIARSSTSHFAIQSVDVRSAGAEHGARYVMEGSLRQAGTKLRLSVQLVDTVSGAHLWAENYERTFSPEAAFELQDDLVPRIVSTVADMNGILPRSMSKAVRGRDPGQLSPYESVLRSFEYFERVTPEDLAAARSALELAVQKAPASADAWAMLALLYVQDYGQGFNLQPDSLTSGLAAARRAVEAGPSNHLAHFSLAQALFFEKEFPSFRNAAERAVALNPMDGNSMAFLGEMLTYAGDWERGLELSGRAKQLNPNHPGWYWYADFSNAYRQGDYRGALGFARKFNMPNHWGGHAVTVAVCGQLGESDAAGKALRDLLKLRPGFAATVRTDMEKWWNPEFMERMIEGWRKAGLEIAPKERTGARPLDEPHSSAKATSGTVRADEGFWVAVLPFRGTSGDADLEALADGLTEDVTTGLSRFPYLQVIAHNSAMAYKGRAADIRTVGRELGARYLIEGSIRKRGRAIRVNAQLMDAASGTQLWAEAYDREISDAGTFQIQDDLTDHIVTSVADGYGVLVRSMAAPTRGRRVEELSASELVLRHYAFMQQVDPQEHAALRDGLERALERDPNHAIAWACLSNLYLLEYYDRFNPREKPLERGREAAWRAVKIDPTCQMGWKELAAVHFFSRDFAAFRETAERAISLNPRDGTTLAYMALMIGFSGDWERGLSLAQRTIDLNRHHPGWYHNIFFHHHYRKGEYESALQAAKKINMPEFHWMHLMTAAACGMLGRHEEGRTAIESLRKYNPAFLDLENVREDLGTWDPDKNEVERFLQGLQKAGLKYGSADSAGTEIEPKLKSEPTAAARSASIATTTASGVSRADEGFWVAVLPFKYAGTSAELKGLADGLSEEVVTGLSRFSYLRVIARSSTSNYANQSVDVRTAGKELGARYVMEGSLRQAGSKLRLAVQLVDAVSGAHLWAENYERSFSPESVFELQDDLVPRIVSTVADGYGVLPYSMSDLVRSKAPDQLSPYEALLRSMSYGYRASPEEHAVARTCLERAVQQAPGYADGWAVLSLLYADEYGLGFNAQPDPLGRALQAARRAADAAPSNSYAQTALAKTLFFRKEFQAFRAAAEQAISLNPMDGAKLANLGSLLAYSGDWERGCALAERAMQLNPRHPGWYWFPLVYNAYRKRDYQGSVNLALKINLPGFFPTYEALAAAYGQLGERDAASQSLSEMLKLVPSFGKIGRVLKSKWFDPEMVEHVLDGLRKAGLEIADQPSSTGAKPVAETAGNAAARAPSIAVLPFANMSADKDQEYFSDGLAEEIINLLAQVAGLKVIARTSSFAFRGKEEDVRKIADTLAVTHVLEGSVRRAGNRIRVTAQLIAATDGSHLWSERYDRELSDIFALQDEMAAAIAGVLRVKLSGEAAPQRYTPKLAAYEAYLKARHFLVKVTPESLELARHCYEQASELDPAFGLAHVGLGYYWTTLTHFGRCSAHKAVPAARAEARRALQIDPSLPEAHALLGHLAAMYDMDWAAAERHFDFPLAKQAGFPTIQPMYGGVQFVRGNAEEAIKLAQRAIEQDPLEVWPRMNLHAFLQAAGRDTEALEQLKKVVELDENQVVALVSMAMIHADQGDLAQALVIARRAYAVGLWFPDTIGVLAALLRRNGEVAESQSLAKTLGSGEALGDSRARALFHLLCGELDEGADWVEKAIEQRDPSMMYYLRFVVCKGLRASPRWPKIARMINLPAGAGN